MVNTLNSWSVGDSVVLQTFNGTTASNQSEDSENDYGLLVGQTGVVVQDRPTAGIEANRVLVQFACDVAGMGLACHNPIRNALWVRSSDLGPRAVAVAVGDVFSMDVGERVGLCRVIAGEKPRGAWDVNGRWRVLTCEWVGQREELAAALSRSETFAPVRLQRLKGKLHVQSIGGPPVAGFDRVGVHLPSASERKLRSPKNPGAWEWVPLQLKTELEYRADPAKFEEQRKRTMREEKAARAAAVREMRAKKKARPTSLAPRDDKMLTALGAAKILESGLHPPGFVTAVRAEVKSMSDALRRAKSVSAVVSSLKATTFALNRLDATDQTVMTTDAEELVDVLVGLCVAAGLDEDFAAQTLDELRDF